MKQLSLTLDHIASTENLIEAWQEFVAGKQKRIDVQEFSLHLMDNAIALHREIISRSYRHGPYCAFSISDPKPRNIHKALVRDRLLHHAIYRKLYPFFDRTFIAHSYSCRENKGTHKALDCFDAFARRVSITKDEYDKKLQDLKDRQYRLNLELDEHTKADHEYHIHVSTVINLCRRIRIIFEGSEVSEKHAILNFVLSNLSVTDRKLKYSLRKPFDAVLDLALSSNLAPRDGRSANRYSGEKRQIAVRDCERLVAPFLKGNMQKPS